MATNIRYRAAAFESFRLGLDTDLLHLPGTSHRFVLPSLAKQMLQVCGTPKSFEAQASHVCDVLHVPKEKKQLIQSILQDLITKGLLVEIKELLPSPAREFAQTRSITSLAFVTADRPSLLDRAIDSYMANLAAYDRRVEIIVMDGSNADQTENYKDAIRSSEPGRPIRYADRRQKQAYVALFAKEGINPDDASFAMLGDFDGVDCTIGANRNCVLLDTIGENVFLADDDTVCETALHPQRQCRLRLIGHENPRDTWIYRDRDEIISDVKWSSADVLRYNEELLGRNVRDIVAETPTEMLDIDAACKHLLMSLKQDGAIVLATINGVVGDCGTHSPLGLLLSKGETRKRLEDEDLFKRSMESRETLTVAQCKTITHWPMCQATTMGLANWSELPPFLPIGRNEDGFFGVLLSAIRKNCFFGHVPVAIFHSSDLGRTFHPLPALRISELASALILNAVESRPEPMSTSIRFIGRELAEIAGLPDVEFWRFVYDAVAKKAVERLRPFESILGNASEYPSFWRDRVAQIYQHLVTEMTSDSYGVPEEFRELRLTDATVGKTKGLVAKIGSLLCSWPDMRAVATHLKSRGIRLSGQCGV